MIKTVLVHLDGTAEDELRIRHAEAIATSVQAAMTGLFTNPLANVASFMPIDGGGVAAQVLADLDDEARRRGDVVEERLAERFSRLSVSNEIRRVDAPPGQLTNRAVSEARCADLFVTSRPYRIGEASPWQELFEAVLFESGRAIYVVPPERGPADVVRRILVAWRDSREAARAVAEAAPLLAQATRTAVVLVDPATVVYGEKRAPEMDIAKQLNRYGTQVEVSLTESAGSTVGDVVLDQARRMSADLIVMGAYGHSRAREWILGGVTRDMLENAEFPIILAH
jgi:nucleotide-binding universal stress UspA family protein